MMVSGCASYGPSVYQNTSSAAGNQVYASGAAATEAARANVSYTCHGGNCSSSRISPSAGNRQQTFEERIQESVANNLVSGLNRAMNQAINEALY